MFLLYQKMINEVEYALGYRATKMSYDRKHVLLEALEVF